MVSQLSKWKNLFGEQLKTGQYESLTPRNNQNTDGTMIDVSPDLIAVNWFTSGGGAIGIFQTTNFVRVASEFPLIRGHKAAVTDLKFSPFNNSLLASSSEDGTVKLWDVPLEGLKEDLTTEIQIFNNHSKKASLLSFHPSVKEVIASAGSDNDLYAWNITDSSIISSYKMDEQAYSIEFNAKGNLLGVMNKNKKANIFDVRVPDTQILSVDGHGSSKVQKFGFADGDYAFSSGFNNSGYREVKVYDIRNFTKEIQSHKIDSLSGMLSHFYDEDSGLLFVYGKGESVVTYLEFKEGSLKTASSYSGGDQQISLAFFPKRTVDYNSCELARCAKLTKNSCNYLSFKYPRRNQGFSEEFYPECVIGEPSMTFEEWKNGEDKPLARKKITEIENKFKTEPMKIEKKVVEERKTMKIDDVIAENQDLKKRISDLETIVEELTAKLNQVNQN